jgi:hypothetical protein
VVEARWLAMMEARWAIAVAAEAQSQALVDTTLEPPERAAEDAALEPPERAVAEAGQAAVEPRR